MAGGVAANVSPTTSTASARRGSITPGTRARGGDHTRGSSRDAEGFFGGRGGCATSSGGDDPAGVARPGSWGRRVRLRSVHVRRGRCRRRRSACRLLSVGITIMLTTVPGSHSHIVMNRGAQQDFVSDDDESQLSHTRPGDVPGCGQALADVRGRKAWSGGVSRGHRGRTWIRLDPLFHLAKVEVPRSCLVALRQVPAPHTASRVVVVSLLSG